MDVRAETRRRIQKMPLRDAVALLTDIHFLNTVGQDFTCKEIEALAAVLHYCRLDIDSVTKLVLFAHADDGDEPTDLHTGGYTHA